MVRARDTSYVHGYDLTAAYAVSDHVAITTSYHHRRDQDFYAGYPKDPFDTSLVRYKRSSWEAGGGYFFSLDDAKVSNFGIYGGIGSESFSIQESGRKDTADYSRHLDMKPFKFYVAPCYYFVTAPVRFALMFRLSWIRYNDLQSNYTSTEAETFHLNNLSGRTLTVGEFGFDMQFRYPKFPWVALEGQASFSGTPTYFHARTFNVSGGLVIEPYRLLQKK